MTIKTSSFYSSLQYIKALYIRIIFRRILSISCLDYCLPRKTNKEKDEFYPVTIRSYLNTYLSSQVFIIDQSLTRVYKPRPYLHGNKYFPNKVDVLEIKFTIIENRIFATVNARTISSLQINRFRNLNSNG